MLVENTLFGVTDKVKTAIDRIKEFEPPEGYYVAFSGGKDSVVILDLVKRSGVKFDAHYNITGIDPPELFYFIRDEHPEVQRHRPEVTLWHLIVKKMMPPTRIVRYCCEHLKERGGAGRTVMTGVRWAESKKRSQRKVVESCFRKKHKFYVNPIIDWTDKDVWQYIKDNGVKYCSLYDEGFKRLGCIGCPMAGKKRIAEFKRWPRIERLYKKAFAAAAAAARNMTIEHEGWASTHPLLANWTDGESMFNWWMEDKHLKGNPDQTIMYE